MDVSGRSPAPEENSPDEISSVLIKDFFSRLRKAWKSISMYRHDVARFPDFLKPASEPLEEYFQRHDMLSLTVDEARLRLGQAVVYEDALSDQNLAFRFYREGVRLLILRAGLDVNELLDFSLVCLSGAGQRDSEDLVSQLWEKEFGHVEYVLVDSFAVSGDSDEQTKVEVEKILAYLHQGLTASNADVFNIARLSLDDLETELEDVTGAAGLKVADEVATEFQKKTLLQELQQEEQHLLMPRFIELLILLVQYPMDQVLAESLEDLAYQMLDAALLEADLDRIVRLMDKLKALMGQTLLDDNKQWVQRVGRGLLGRMGDAQRISRVGDILEAANPQTTDAVRRYLEQLEESALIALLDILSRLNRKEAREIVCAQLVRLGAGHMDVLERRLTGATPNLVRDLLCVVDALNPPDKLAIVARLLDHPNMMIRIEALRSIGESGDLSRKDDIMNAVGDKEAQVRMLAARYLPVFAPRVCGPMLRERIDSPEFAELSPREQSVLYTAYAQSMAPEVVEFFREKLREHSLFGKKRLQEEKRALISTLALSGSLVGLQVIDGELKAGVKDRELEAYMRRALAKARQKAGESGSATVPAEEGGEDG